MINLKKRFNIFSKREIFVILSKFILAHKILMVLEYDLIILNIFYDVIRENHLFITLIIQFTYIYFMYIPLYFHTNIKERKILDIGIFLFSVQRHADN